MRKMYTTKRLLGTAACAAALFAAMPAAVAQEGVEVVDEKELFEDQAAPENDQKVEVGAAGEIDLHVKELEITKVLQLLSIQSQRNIIASRGVENAKVSADLYGVSFEDALKSILEPNGFGYVEEGNFIYVLTRDELNQREVANRKTDVKIVRLDWLRADETAAFVTPMLSDNGSITVSGNVADGFQPSIDDAGADQYAGPQTMVIRDYEENVESIMEVIDKLDVQPRQVIIEATILNTSLTENNQFGVDFSLFTDLTGAGPLDIIDNAISSGQPAGETLVAGQSNVGNVASQAGGVKLGFVAGDASIFVSALDSVSDTTVVASPKTTVLDRNRADIQVGERVPFLTTTVTETTSTQTIEFLDTGTQLSVRPFVSSDGKVRLELRPSVSSAESVDVGGGQTAPQEDTVELITNVIVESGQTIVLGGLFTESTTVSRSQVPGLGDIPILGAAFQGKTDTVGRSEIIFLVKATVIENEQLVELSNEMKDKVDVARLAERERLLPWSRSKLTAAHLVNARKHYDQAMSLTGEARDKKMSEALYCVDLALHMNPSMVDALMLKEQITGEASYIKYEHSLLNQAYDSVLEAEMKALGLPELPVVHEQPQADEAVEAGDLIEPEPISQTQPQPEAAAEPGATAGAPDADAEVQADTTAGADAADAVLEALLAEELDGPNAVPVEAVEVEPARPGDEDFDAPLGPQEAAEQGWTEPEAGETAAVELIDEPTDEADPSWRELSTAELLQLAAEASEENEAEAEAESEEATQAADADEDAQPESEEAAESADADEVASPEADTETETADADTESETDNTTADVPTDTD